MFFKGNKKNINIINHDDKRMYSGISLFDKFIIAPSVFIMIIIIIILIIIIIISVKYFFYNDINY